MTTHGDDSWAPTSVVPMMRLCGAELGVNLAVSLHAVTDAIRDEIISLSERFHIITPFTSLLVLETDADRERFGVKRHFEMRDGERFFAEGHDNANFDLRQHI